jgi:hypothetical protein
MDSRIYDAGKAFVFSNIWESIHNETILGPFEQDPDAAAESK